MYLKNKAGLEYSKGFFTMVPKQTAEGPRRRQIYHNHNHLLLSLLLTVFLNTGSAFIQLPIHAAAMSTSETSYSGSGNSAKPLSAQLEGDNNNNESETSNNGVEEILLLPEASGDTSIPSIKLGGTYIMCMCTMFILYGLYVPR